MNRHIPFGYAVQNGEVVTDERESTAVREIFNMYLSGASYQQIAKNMESAGVNYRQDSSNWNKNMVKRILENSRYTGNKEYPAILTVDTFKKVTSAVAAKVSKRDTTSKLDIVKGKLYCGICGSAFYRRDKGKKSRFKWICRGCDTVRLSDDILETAIIEKMNMLIANPLQIRLEQIATEQSIEAKRLINEVNRGFDHKELDRQRIKALLFNLADERYKQCDDGDSERQTAFLRELFSKQKSIKELDGGLFEKTVRRLHIGQNGDIILELTNGQKI